MVVKRAMAGIARMLALVGVLLCAAPTAATASDPDPYQAEAEKLGYAAFDLYEKEQYAEAIDLFRQADAKVHSPVFIYYIGKCELQLGHLVEAQTAFEQVISEHLADDAPDPHKRAKNDAAKDLADLQPRVPGFVLQFAQTDWEGVQVTLDGQPLEDPERHRIPVNPGEHRVNVTTADGRQSEKSFQAVEGQVAQVEISFTTTGPGDDDDDDDGGKSYVPAAVAYGIGGAGLLLWGIAGGMFVDQAGDLKDRCPDDQCAPEDEAEGDSVTALGDAATAGLVIGGLGVVAGTILLFVPAEDEEGAAGEQSEQTQLRPSLRVGPTGVQFQLQF